MLQRMNTGFAVQCKAELRKLFPDRVHALPQIVFVRVNEDEIVHVPDVNLDPQPFLDKMVQLVQHRELNELADLAAEAEPFVAGEAVDHIAHGLRCPPVRYQLPHGGLRCFVRRLREEVADVAFQYPAVSAVLPVVPAQHDLEPAQRIVCATPELTRRIVPDEMLRHIPVQAVVTEASLELPVHDPSRHDRALLRLVDGEHLILADVVAPVLQRSGKRQRIFNPVAFIAHHAVLPADIAAAAFHGCVKRVESNGFVEIILGHSLCGRV